MTGQGEKKNPLRVVDESANSIDPMDREGRKSLVEAVKNIKDL